MGQAHSLLAMHKQNHRVKPRPMELLCWLCRAVRTAPGQGKHSDLGVAGQGREECRQEQRCPVPGGEWLGTRLEEWKSHITQGFEDHSKNSGFFFSFSEFTINY